MNKKSILVTSAIGSLFIVLAVQGLLGSLYEFKYLELIFNTTLFFPFILIFSLITHFSPERVFQSWWKFARIAIPVVFGLALLINLELHHSPVGEFQNMFDAPVLWAMYIIFSVGSVVQIIRGYRQ